MVARREAVNGRVGTGTLRRDGRPCRGTEEMRLQWPVAGAWPGGSGGPPEGLVLLVAGSGSGPLCGAGEGVGWGQRAAPGTRRNHAEQGGLDLMRREAEASRTGFPSRSLGTSRTSRRCRATRLGSVRGGHTRRIRWIADAYSGEATMSWSASSMRRCLAAHGAEVREHLAGGHQGHLLLRGAFCPRPASEARSGGPAAALLRRGESRPDACMFVFNDFYTAVWTW
jgi:hypothetical protein